MEKSLSSEHTCACVHSCTVHTHAYTGVTHRVGPSMEKSLSSEHTHVCVHSCTVHTHTHTHKHQQTLHDLHLCRGPGGRDGGPGGRDTELTLPGLSGLLPLLPDNLLVCNTCAHHAAAYTSKASV